VAPNQGLDARTTSAAPDHEVDLRLRDAAFGELLRLALRRSEKGISTLANESDERRAAASLSELLRHASQNVRGQVLHLHPRQNQKARVVSQQI
jgi:hypothetical protein